MAALDNIASELLKSANEADLIYKRTRDQAQRDKAVRLRRIVENLRNITLGASDLNGLSDVTLSAPANGQVLTYNSTINQWENQTPGGGGGGGDMYKSTYDVDNDGIVDGSETTQIIVRNSTGSTLTKGQVVYLSGATGNRPNAVLSQANTEATSSKTIGIVVANIANNSDGYVAVNGTLHNLDTSAFADGVAVWLSATTAGAYTSTIPAEPNHTVFIGYVARSHPTQGRLVILIQNGYELNELHGVLISSEANNDLLVYESSSTLWKNKSISTIFGGTPLVSVPTLDQVTTAGNTTTNAITVGGLTVQTSVLTVASFSGTNTSTRVSINNTQATPNAGFNLLANGVSKWSLASYGATSDFTFYNDALLSDALFIKGSTNNVLIGTTTDGGYKLDVNGTARINGAITVQTNVTTVASFSGTSTVARVSINNITATPNVGFNLLANGVSKWSLASYGATSDFTFYNDALSSDALFIKGNTNNVLIGTTTDAGYKLHVNGTARFSGNVQIIGSTNTAASSAISITNSANTDLLYIRNDGYARFDGTLAAQAGIAFLNSRIVGSNQNDYLSINLPRIRIGGAVTGFDATTIVSLEGSKTASSNIARGTYLNQTLVAAANNDVLVGLDINPTFTNGAFTGVQNIPLRVNSQDNAVAARFVSTSGSLYIVPRLSSLYGTYIGTHNSTQTAQIPLSLSANRFIFDNGNVLIGTTTDAGYKLDVSGTVRFTHGLTIDYFGATIGGVTLALSSQAGGTISSGASAGNNNGPYITLSGPAYLNPTAGNSGMFSITGLYYASSGTAIFNHLNLAPTINNSGTYSGIVRGIYYNPTLTSLTGTTHRAIETTSGDVIFNGGNVAIGTTTPTDKFHIVDNTNGNKFARISAGGTDASAAWVAQNDQVDNIVYRVFGSAVTGSQMGQALARSASLIANLGGTGKFLIGSFSGTDLIFGTSDQARMRLVDATGNFLIGTMTDNGNKLTVSGDIDAQGYKVNNVLGYTGILNIPTNPPGQQNIDIQGGIVINIF